MNKLALIIITMALAIGIGIVLFGQSKNTTDSTDDQSVVAVVKDANVVSKNTTDSTDDQSAPNVEIRDGVQYVTINARGGYSPKVSTAEANIPTKLIVKTNGTYDCSAALVIRSIGYQKILPQTGEEIIDLGTPQTGTLQGLCSMGMYNFKVNFK